MNRLRSLSLLALALLSLPGCVFTPLGTARTLASGETRHQAGLGLANLDGFLWPSWSYEYRHGLADGAEVGVGFRDFGPTVDVKLALLRTDDVALAVEPTLTAWPDFSGTFLNLPLLFDLDVASWATLTLATSPMVGVPDTDFRYLGTGAGVALWVTDGFAVQPSVQWLTPLGREPDLDDGYGFAGLGFLFGPPPVR